MLSWQKVHDIFRWKSLDPWTLSVLVIVVVTPLHQRHHHHHCRRCRHHRRHENIEIWHNQVPLLKQSCLRDRGTWHHQNYCIHIRRDTDNNLGWCCCWWWWWWCDNNVVALVSVNQSVSEADRKSNRRRDQYNATKTHMNMSNTQYRPILLKRPVGDGATEPPAITL